LARGISPLLHPLALPRNGNAFDESGVDSIADMLEARAAMPSCKRFTCIEEMATWFNCASLTTQIRLLRVLLPSVTTLSQCWWKQAFEPSFRVTQALYLTDLEFWFDEGDETIFPWNVFEAVPALERLRFEGLGQDVAHVAALQAISAALRHGVLQNLVEITLENCDLRNGAVRDFLGALEDSGCAKRLKGLRLECSKAEKEDMRALADFLCRDTLPALEELSLHGNPNITDVGVVSLAEALLKATQTSLRVLTLSDVGMGDEGIAALSSLIYRGRMEQMRELRFSENGGITKEGIKALAQAIEAHMLPVLKDIYVMELKGIRAIGRAVIKGCPQLERIVLNPNEVDKKDVLEILLKAGGHKASIHLRD
jgi:hypothetical protein